MSRELRTLPKTQLHLHLAGAMRPATLRELAEGPGVPVPSNDARKLKDWAQFQGLYDAARAVIRTPDDITRDLAYAIREAGDILVQLFAPMMPHLAEECWAALGHTSLVSMQGWPEIETDLLVENTITLPVQINGKKRADVTVPRDAGNSDIEAAVLTLDAVKKALDGKAPKKVIVVPQRIVNVVA